MTCPTMHAFNQRGNVVAVPCGSWTCPDCARQNARMWAWRCRITVELAGNHAYFWTFTMRAKYRTPFAAFKDLPLLWDRLRKRLARAGLHTWSYCAFVEGQPKRSDMPHFHIISLQASPVRIKDLAMYSGFGYQADESRVNSHEAASYCAKYASKQAAVVPKNFRRVRASRDWAKLPDSDYPALIVKSKVETTADYLLRVADLTGVGLQLLADAWLDIVGSLD